MAANTGGNENRKVGKNRIKKVLLKKLMLECYGSIQFLADSFGVGWHTMDNFIRKHDDILELYEEQKYVVCNKAKDNIYQSIVDGDMKNSRWLLGRLDHEYKEKLELDGNINIKIEIEGVDKKDVDKI